jgi:uncharacterized protein YuzE
MQGLRGLSLTRLLSYLFWRSLSGSCNTANQARNGPSRSTLLPRLKPQKKSLTSFYKDTTVTTKHLAEGIAADYDAAGFLTGIEILDAVKRLGDPAVFKQVIL